MAGLPPTPLTLWDPGMTEEHTERLTQILATVELFYSGWIEVNILAT